MKCVYLSGGIGGARLLHGLARTMRPESLTAIVNTGDDVDHWGLRVCPDVDTVLYTLSGVADAARGWGLRDETFRALEWVARYGGESWFRIGDGDLALHLMRSAWLREGVALTAVTARLAEALGVQVRVLPMSDDRLETVIETDDEVLAFQDWLVRREGRPDVRRVSFRGQATATEQVFAAIECADAIILGPSNPYVSIDPILSLPGVRASLTGKTVIAVSPIVHGQAIKGPLARMIPRLAGRPADAGGVAAHYGALLRGFVLERGDEDTVADLACLATDTIMREDRDRLRLAREVIDFAERLCC